MDGPVQRGIIDLLRRPYGPPGVCRFCYIIACNGDLRAYDDDDAYGEAHGRRSRRDASGDTLYTGEQGREGGCESKGYAAIDAADANDEGARPHFNLLHVMTPRPRC